jgi:hypothetical protein
MCVFEHRFSDKHNTDAICTYHACDVIGKFEGSALLVNMCSFLFSLRLENPSGLIAKAYI